MRPANDIPNPAKGTGPCLEKGTVGVDRASVDSSDQL